MASPEVITALETLHREIEKLKPAIKHVELAQQVADMVTGIPKLHLDLVEEVLKTDSVFKNGLQKICEKELVEITSEHKKLQKLTAEIQQHIKIEQIVLEKLKDSIQSSYERIEKINFPERLDKLDANVAGIMAAIQSVQSRLDGLERNIADRLRDVLDYQKETRVNLQNGLEQTKAALQTAVDASSKKQQTLTYITWALVVVTIIITFVLKK